jgi:hypothetical protein
MRCRQFKKLILPYLEERVDGVLGNEFRWHKHFCVRCGIRFNLARAKRRKPAPEGALDRRSPGR